MGLPIWRDPDDTPIKREREATVKPDPTTAARSPIRRRSPPVARRRSSYYPSRQPFPPRIERSPPPSQGFNGLRGERRGVPPVSTLLESARTASPSADSLFPRPRHSLSVSARRRADAASAIAQDQRTLLDPGRRQRDAQTRINAEAQRIQAEVVPGDWEDWSEEDREAWLEENNIPRYLYPTAHEATTPDGFVRQSLHRPQSRDGPRQNTLPTPPHDDSIDGDRLFVPADLPTTLRRTSSVRRRHPLSRSWRPESPVNGLGDRNRSPTPADAWEVMRQTITPDATLPSADSSFTSAAASLSFSASNSNNSASTNTSMTELDWSLTNSRRNSNEDEESVSAVDPDNLVCDDDEIAATTAFAEHVYRNELISFEGQQRIARHSANLLESGQHRYAHRDDQRTVEIGFRLIDEALNTPEGRARVFSLSESLPEDLRQNLSSWINRDSTSTGRTRTRLGHVTDDGIAAAIYRRPDASAPAGRHAEELLSASGAGRRMLQSPPPYEPRALSIQPEISISTDEPLAHPVAPATLGAGSLASSRPVTPPTARSERDVADALLSGDEEDLSAVRRIVERLAQRDDVPQEWWMSMGLNLSRTRARSSSPRREEETMAEAMGLNFSRSQVPRRSRSPRREEIAVADAVRRVRAGRVERDRGNASRL